MRALLARVRRLAALSLVLYGAACDGPGAAIHIAGAHASRAADGRIVVDVELVANEGLGGNVGTYCTRVTFTGQTDPAEVCSADLEDGDTKTVRLTSDRWLPPGAAIFVRVRISSVDVGRTLVAPE